MYTYINTIEKSRTEGPTRTLTAALKRSLKQFLSTHSITQVKYDKSDAELERVCFPMTYLHRESKNKTPNSWP